MDELFFETKEWLKDLGLHYTTLSELLEAGPCEKVCCLHWNILE